MAKSRGRPFQAGNQFGKGRPKGSRNKFTLQMQEMLREYGPSIMRTCIARALKGDPVPLRLCMERLLAPQKEPKVNLRLGTLKDIPGMEKATKRLLKSICSGEISPDAGEKVAGILTDLLQAALRGRTSEETREPMPDFIVMTEPEERDESTQEAEKSDEEDP